MNEVQRFAIADTIAYYWPRRYEGHVRRYLRHLIRVVKGGRDRTEALEA